MFRISSSLLSHSRSCRAAIRVAGAAVPPHADRNHHRTRTTMIPSPRFFSTSSTTTATATSADLPPKYYYGRVKLFLRNKAYGFIAVDGDSDDNGKDDDSLLSNQSNNSPSTTLPSDIFVHRNGIYGADLHPMADIFVPHLIKGERVRFELKVDPSRHDASVQAINVVYEDGSPIPYYRMGYVKSMANLEYRALGETVHNIITRTKLKQRTTVNEPEQQMTHVTTPTTFVSDGASTNEATTITSSTTASSATADNNHHQQDDDDDDDDDDDTLGLIEHAVEVCERRIAAAQERYDTQALPPRLGREHEQESTWNSNRPATTTPHATSSFFDS